MAVHVTIQLPLKISSLLEVAVKRFQIPSKEVIAYHNGQKITSNAILRELGSNSIVHIVDIRHTRLPQLTLFFRTA
jgi:hypothetical protein